jgi:myosin-5
MYCTVLWHNIIVYVLYRDNYALKDWKSLSPHVYSTSARAYKGLVNNRKNQSVLVSGESGAGKTETVKLLMGHITHINQIRGKGKHINNESTIDKLLKASPLLESFGNAKTVRNDNSSRFGKFSQLEFLFLNGESAGDNTAECCLVGSKCVHYLLEKSRVVSQFGTERNFHVLYQLLAAPMDTKKMVHLSGHTSKDFNYTNNGDTETEAIEGRKDGERFDTTAAALSLLGIDGDLQRLVWEILSAILHLGNVQLLAKKGDADACVLDAGGAGAPTPRSNNVTTCCTLFGVDLSSFSNALICRTIDVEGQKLPVPLTVEQACVGRDALAKEIYARLFSWLVAVINYNTSSKRVLDGSASKGTISLLDIFGFECFAVNRFEQFCINFANEKLQQKFTEDILLTVQVQKSCCGIRVVCYSIVYCVGVFRRSTKQNRYSGLTSIFRTIMI